MIKDKKNPVIVGIGELLWDIFPMEKKVGGAPVNFAYHASDSGIESYAISAVGKDNLGKEIIALINEIDLNHLITKSDYPTGTVKVELNQGSPIYTIAEDVAWDYIPLTEPVKQIAYKTDAVCFGTLAQRSIISRETIREFISLTPENSYRIFDINLRLPFYSSDIIKDSLHLCNILRMNDEELEILKEMFLIDETDNEDTCKKLIETYQLKYVILTAGEKYSMIVSPKKVSYLKSPKIKVVDTVGAGDSFTAAFITSLLKGKTMEEAHLSAVERAAYVCTVPGAWAKLRQNPNTK